MRTIVFDCETTGLTLPSVLPESKQPQIIELALVVFDDGKLRSTHEWLINPGKPLSEEIIKITGISDAVLKDRPAFKAIADDVLRLFESADVIYAHNAPFDMACLTYELQRCGRKLDVSNKDVICTVQEYVHEFGRRPKLTELYEAKIGKPLAQTHRAMDDVNALCEVLLKEELL